MIHRVGEKQPRIHPSAFVHPAATVMGDVEIGEHSSVWPGAVLRGDFGPIRVGARTNVQDNAVVHTGQGGTHIGDGCVIAHLAHVEAAVIEDGCLIGIGARVLDGVLMRRHSVAAAGAVLVPGTEVPTGMRAQGVPAKLVAAGRLGRERIEEGAREYVEMAKLVASSLQEDAER